VRIGIIGSGNIGATLARRFTEAGHDVTLANSRGPVSLEPLVAELGPRAHAAADVSAAAAAGDIVVLAVPFFLYDQLPVEALAGKVVIDAMNYFPDRDGELPGLADDSTTSSELLAGQLPGARRQGVQRHGVDSSRVGRAARRRSGAARIFVAGDDAGRRRQSHPGR
jgi:predicted dinucleotide-binding enzyme